MAPVPSPSKSKSVSKSKSGVRISVVIAGHNRPDSLRETLSALRNQTLSAKQYEVIVIGFTGTSLQAVADENSKLAKHAFTYVEIGTRWPDAKRNEGIRRSRGEWVAFTDDDVIPSSTWLESILASFEKNPAALGVEGLTDGDNTPLLSHATKNAKGGAFPTCNMAFRKAVLENVGGFDEAYHFFREDTDIAYKVLQHGEIVFDPAVKVFHPTRRVLPKSILNELGMTRGEIRLAKKFPLRYAANYGWVGRGGWLQAIFSWTILMVTLYATLFEHTGALLIGLGILYIFRSLVSFRGRTSTMGERAQVFAYMLARDLAYPFFFTYFWLTERAERME